PNLSGGAPLAEFLELEPGETVIGLVQTGADAPGVALGTTRGVVKRVDPSRPGTKDSWDLIRLGDDDEVRGIATLTDEASELVFITSDAQLLRFSADSVRPQGRGGGGVTGIRVGSGAKVIF